jgi:hypothetical protein
VDPAIGLRIGSAAPLDSSVASSKAIDELVVLLRSEVIANSEAQHLNEFHDEARESINRVDHNQAVPWEAFVAFAKTTGCLAADLARKSSRLLLASLHLPMRCQSIPSWRAPAPGITCSNRSGPTDICPVNGRS